MVLMKLKLQVQRKEVLRAAVAVDRVQSLPF